MNESLYIQLSPDQTQVQLEGFFSYGGILIPETIHELLEFCQKAIENQQAQEGEKKIILDFLQVQKITTLGIGVLMSDVSEFSRENQAPLQLKNIPSLYKPTFEATQWFYEQLLEQGNIAFRDDEE